MNGEPTTARRIVISTPELDRDRDRMDVNGLSTENFMRTGGPVMFGHGSNGRPAVANADRVYLEGGKLLADITFNTTDFLGLRDPGPDAKFNDFVAAMFDRGRMPSASIGFIPTKFEPNDEGGLDISESELVEFSVVPVPSNPGANASEAGYAPYVKSLEKRERGLVADFLRSVEAAIEEEEVAKAESMEITLDVEPGRAFVDSIKDLSDEIRGLRDDLKTAREAKAETAEVKSGPDPAEKSVEMVSYTLNGEAFEVPAEELNKTLQEAISGHVGGAVAQIAEAWGELTGRIQ